MIPVILSNLPPLLLLSYGVIVSSIFLCWGSFLNVIAYRLLYTIPFFTTRSRCPQCNKTIAWYDLVPLLSWLLLRGRCRNCSAAISWLYCLIEVTALVSFWGIISLINSTFWISYFLLFSVLIITIRTDLEEMVILRPFSLGLIPLGLGASALNLLPITPLQSLEGAFLGFCVFYLIKKLYLLLKKEEGMGAGDPELLAGIGAFVGPLGCWQTVLIASFMGSLAGMWLFMRYGAAARKYPLPFGPFLAFGAFLVVLLG